ncbi:MAG: hypothetical protein JWR22_3130 [Herminiimonas sp.]|nr:hypothetical protein [Herminiimonas sp.]
MPNKYTAPVSSKDESEILLSVLSPNGNAMSELASTAQIPFSVIDKLILVLPLSAMSTAQLEVVVDRLKSIVGVRAKTSKSDSYKRLFIATCPSKTKIVFGVIPSDNRMNFGVRIICNPGMMSLEDTKFFHLILKQIFMPDWKSIL